VERRPLALIDGENLEEMRTLALNSTSPLRKSALRITDGGLGVESPLTAHRLTLAQPQRVEG